MLLGGCCVGVGLLGCGPRDAHQAPRHWRIDPSRPYTVRITGRDFGWHIRYPGLDGQLGTEDDVCGRRHLHLPANSKVLLQLCSDDYVYSLALPDWNVKQIAVPDLSFTMEIETHAAGEFALRGNQMCGYTHPELLGRLTVHGHKSYDDWLARQRAALDEDE